MMNPDFLHKSASAGSSGRWWLALRIATGLALLGFVFSRGASIKEVAAALAGASPARLVFAVAVAVTGELVTAVKWKLLIASAGGRLPLGKAVRTSFVGMFYNNFFPGSVGGDIVRALMVARYAGGKASAAASTFMQRNTGLAALFFVGIPAAVVWHRQMNLPDVVWQNSLRAVVASPLLWLGAASVGYAAVNMVLFSRRLYAGVWRYLHKITGAEPCSYAGRGLWRVKAALGRAAKGGFKKLQRFHQELHGYPFWQGGPLALSVVSQLLDIFLVWNLAQALSIRVSLTDLLVVVPMVTLANLLPVTINGIGLRETMYLALLTGVGVAPSEAVALGLAQFGVVLLLSASGGIVHLVSKAEIPGAT